MYMGAREQDIATSGGKREERGKNETLFYLGLNSAKVERLEGNMEYAQETKTQAGGKGKVPRNTNLSKLPQNEGLRPRIHS